MYIYTGTGQSIKQKPGMPTTLSSFGEIRTFKTVSSTLADSPDRYFNPFLAPPDPPTPHVPPPVLGTTSPITLRFNSLYHYLRAQKVNATLITMFNSSTPLSISVFSSAVSRTLRAFLSETYSLGNGICPWTNCSEHSIYATPSKLHVLYHTQYKAVTSTCATKNN